MNAKRIAVCLLPVTLLAGCVSMPTGPRVTVMPAPGKPFEVFVQDDQACRGYALQSIGGKTPSDSAIATTAGTAVVGAALGAAAGAIAGGHRGAGTGAAIGMVGGSLFGAGQGNDNAYEAQRRYDIAYQQCMYAKGNQVPGYAINPVPAGAAYPPPPAR